MSQKRKSVSMRPEYYTMLKQHAESKGKSMSQVVEEALEVFMGKRPTLPEKSVKSGNGMKKTGLRDRVAASPFNWK